VVTLGAFYVVSSAIWIGGVIFGFAWMNPSNEYDCVALDQSVKDRWAYPLSKIAKQTNYDACLISVGHSFKDTGDVNGDGVLSRCEN